MLTRYVLRDLVRNPRRTLSTALGIALGIGLFSAVLFFVDGSSASMTQRAVAPLPIDMQLVLGSPLGVGLRLTERVETAGADETDVMVNLELVNDGSVPASEVVVRSELPPGAAYVPGSTTLDGAALADVGGDPPLAAGPAKTGLNLGTVGPGTTVTVSYRATWPATGGPGVRSSFSSRELVVPVSANEAAPLSPQDLADRIAAIDGVAFAETLSFVDLPAGSLSAGPTTAMGPVRLFGFGADYRQRYADIDLVAGSQAPGGALISTEAAAELDVSIDDTVAVMLPGSDELLNLTISGIADLSRARALFYSRQGANLEDFIYTRNSVVIDEETFASIVLPTFRTATTTRGDILKSIPILEVDIGVERSRLDADPGSALGQTAQIGADVSAIGAGRDYLVDNVSNTLQVAQADAAVAKRMFAFLGVPGGLLAATLAGYAGGVLAGAQRREQAILRVRGANRRHLLHMLALRTTLLTAVGSLLGVALGLASAAAVLGSDALARASTASLFTSGLVGVGCGFVATGLALYAAGRASIGREINEDRARLLSGAPLWRRHRLDFLGVLAVTVLTIVAVVLDAFAGASGSVYEGRGVDLKLPLLVLPLGVWLAGAMLLARLFARGLAGLRHGRGEPFSHLVWALFSRSVRRRSWSSADGMLVVALIVGLGTCVTAFAASYDSAKSADARFSNGSDIRVVPSPTSSRAFDASFARELEVDGIMGATPVVFSVQNSVLRSEQNEDAINLASVDPLAFLDVAAVEDASFVDLSAEAALSSLADDPAGVLVSVDMAEFLGLEVGGTVGVLFGKGSDDPVMSEMRVAGLFEELAAFPEGAHALINISRQLELAEARPDFYLARTVNSSHAALERAVGALRRGPGAADSLEIETRETRLDKDQSSLAALNIRGLLALDSSYALGMGIVAIGIFVFGLLLARRREYVTMRAQGMHASEIRLLILADAAAVAVGGCIAGVAVGVVMTFYFVSVLRPLFVLVPRVVVPPDRILLLAALVLAAAFATSLVATSIVNRLRPTELLRDE